MDNKIDGVPGAGEDETRADWSTNVNSDPPDPASPPAAPPATPPAPVTPSGPPPGVVLGPPGAPPPWQPVGGGAWTPPPADGGRYAVPGVPGLEFAGGAPRVVAYVIDAIIITILNVIVGIVLGIVLLAVAPNLGARPIVGLLIGAAIDAAYFMLLWTSAARATLGMRVLNLQVGNAFDGRRLETGQAFRRWVALGSWISIAGVTTSLAGITGLIGFAWAVVLLLTTISSPTKQGLHDRFANTAVVRPAGASSSVIIGCLVIVVLLFAALALAVIVSFGVLAPLSS